MKKVSFLVAFLAIVQIALGQRIAQAQQRLADDRPTVEEALDRAGQDVAEDLERLVAELGVSAEQLSQTLERWAEENAQELDNWSAKYAKQWESWGNRFEQKLERLAQEQEGIWQQWSKNYERKLNKWVNELESEDLNPEHLGEFVERNLDMISKMPLGQMVDQVLEDGIGELSEAPWESLEELGALAKDALDEPLGEIAEILDADSERRRALERGVRELEDSFRQLKDDVGRNISDRDDQEARSTDLKLDPRIRALKKLRQREDATPAQRERIDQIIRTIVDADNLKKGTRLTDRPRIDMPRGDQIKQKIEREKRRQDQTLEEFNQDLRRSRDESRKSDMKARELENRKTKRADGKNLDPGSNGNQKSDKNSLRRAPREGRSPQGAASPSTKRDTPKKSQGREVDSELDLLRKEIEKLRDEVRRLKDESDK